MERENHKKPEQGCSAYQLETTALISIDNYNAFRIRCIMLILGKLNYISDLASFKSSLHKTILFKRN